MSGSQTEEIKARLDIVEFIQSYVRLEKAGINFKACCPFHSEKTPSFFVSPSRQTWHCFGGCGEGGDIFKFVMKIEGLEFPEALRLLGTRAGVTITRENPLLRSARNRLYDVCEAAAHIYERALLTTPAPKEYLKARGIKEETVRAFRIGYVPDEWDFILKELARKGFTAEDAEHAGLAIRRGLTQTGTQTNADKFPPRESARWYDRFRSRIMFPIADANGRIIGFGGRIFESGIKNKESGRTEAKYINSPQTLIYDKSRVLYGFDRAKQEIRAKNRAVVVEGYMDCVMSHQAGIAHTIAVSGTAFTPQQLKVLRRLCDTLVSSFDADAAGESATRRSLALAAQFDFTRLIAAIPSGKDPADTVKDDPTSWRAAVEDAKPMVAFYFDQVFGRENHETAEGKKKISSALLPFVAELSDEIEKAHWIAELAHKLDVPEDAIRKDLSRRAFADVPRAHSGGIVSGTPGHPPAGGHSGQDGQSGETIPSRRALLEDRLVALLAAASEDVRGSVAHEEIGFVSDMNGRLFRVLACGVHDSGTDIASHLEDLRFKGEMFASQISDVGAEVLLCVRELKELSLREQLRVLPAEIQHKERAGDQEGAEFLMKKHKSYAELLNRLHKSA